MSATKVSATKILSHVSSLSIIVILVLQGLGSVLSSQRDQFVDADRKNIALAKGFAYISLSLVLLYLYVTASFNPMGLFSASGIMLRN